MLSSFALAMVTSFVAGVIIVVALAAKAGATRSIAHVLYDTEHPGHTR